MTEVYNKFVKDSVSKSFDLNHRKTIKFNISKYDNAVGKGKTQYKDIELAKQRATNIKYRVLNDLDTFLIDFEANFTSNGGKVIWADDSKTAITEILNILKSVNTKNIVKSKSMTTEEIDFNKYIEKEGIESLETDLGEYIVQLDNDKPYHIVTPAMHKSKNDIAELFNKELGTPVDSTAEELTAYVRDLLRDKFTSADVGVTGGNFLVADIGGIGLTENEGNGVMSVSFPKLHIAIVGIEKMIPSMEDLDTFWPLLATHGTGQKMTVYNSVICGPKQDGEVDGPEEMYVVLLDNRRTELLKQEEQRKALTCIRCGACLNACPVYKNIGGHTYGTTYSGPIGSVISPHLLDMDTYKHLSFASSLCGKCTEVCPLNIDLHELLLANRNDSVKKEYYKRIDKQIMWGWKKVMLKRSLMDIGGSGIKNFMIKNFFKKAWGPRRELPVVSKKSFRQMWHEKYS